MLYDTLVSFSVVTIKNSAWILQKNKTANSSEQGVAIWTNMTFMLFVFKQNKHYHPEIFFIKK